MTQSGERDVHRVTHSKVKVITSSGVGWGTEGVARKGALGCGVGIEF